MPDYRDLMKKVEEHPVPNQWKEIETRPVSSVHPEERRGRVATFATAALIALTGLSVLYLAFRGPANDQRVAGPALAASLPAGDFDGMPIVIATVVLNEGEIATAVSSADGMTWTATEDEGGAGYLLRIDGQTNSVAQRVATGYTITRDALLVSHGSVWVLPKGTSELRRYDGSTGALLGMTQLPGEGVTMDVSNSAIWVEVMTPPGKDPANIASIVRLDPLTFDIVATIPLGSLVSGYADQVSIAGDSVWVLGESLEGDDQELGGALGRIDVETNELVERIPVSGFEMYAMPQSVWVRVGAKGGAAVGGMWVRVDSASSQPSEAVAIGLAGLEYGDDQGLWFVGYDQAEDVLLSKVSADSLAVEDEALISDTYFTDATADAHTATFWVAGVRGVVRVDLVAAS